MPIEQLPDYIKVGTPEQAKPLPYSRTEVIGAGISSGLKETSWSYLSDILSNATARIDVGAQELTEDEFRNMPGVTPDMAWFPGMTMAVANNYIDTFERKKEFQMMKENTTFATTGYYMLGGFIGGLTDPINYIPLGMPVKGAGVMANARRAASANALIEVGLTPFAMGAYAARNEEYTPRDLATNIAFAAGAGAGLSLLASGVRGVTGYLDAFSLMGHRGEPGGLPGIAARAKRGEYTVTDEFGNLLSKEAIDIANTTGVSIRNTDPFVLDTMKIIDTTGQIHDDVNNIRTKEHVTASFHPIDGVKTIAGNNESILKVLSVIAKYINDGESIRIIRSDKPGRSVELKKSEIEGWVDKEIFKVNSNLIKPLQGTQLGETLMDIKKMFVKPFEGTLDDNVAFKSKEIEGVIYEGEFEIKSDKQGFDPANDIGKMYKVDTKTGQRTLLTKEQAVEALKILGQPSENLVDSRSTANNLKTTSNIISKTPEERVLEGTGESTVQDKAIEAADNKQIDQDLGVENRLKTEEELRADIEQNPNQPLNLNKRKTANDLMVALRNAGAIDLRGFGVDIDPETGKFVIIDQAVYNGLTDGQKGFVKKMENIINDYETNIETKQNIIKTALNTNKDCG